MSTSTYFVQECPTCGRRLHVRVQYLGKRVVCQHCCGEFIACDPSSNRFATPESTDALLRHVDELLESAERNKLHSRVSRPR